MGLRVLVLCAEIGEGHLTNARALSEGLRRHSAVSQVELRTDLRVIGRRLGDSMERGFHTHLERVGWTYDLAYRVFFERELPRRAGQLALGLLGARGLLKTVSGARPDVVVAAYPVLSAALGQLRRWRLLSVPVCSAISDPAGLHYWAHPGIDMHLLSWPESVAEVDAIAGPGRSAVVRPPIDPRLFAPLGRKAARARLELPPDRPLVVVSGGGWGMGDLVGASATARELDRSVFVVAVAGHSETAYVNLHDHFTRDSDVRVLGFTEQLPELLMAADALIHTTAGTTALEARAVGCPLIAFGTRVAHVRAQARALANLDLAQWAPDLDTLRHALHRALARGRRWPMSFAGMPDAADVVVETMFG